MKEKSSRFWQPTLYMLISGIITTLALRGIIDNHTASGIGFAVFAFGKGIRSISEAK